MRWPTDFDGAHSAQAPAVPQQTPQQFVKAALAAEREQWTGVDKLADAIDRDSYELALESSRASTRPAPSFDDDEDDPWLCGDDLMGSSG